MSRQPESNFFIPSPLAKYEGLYQVLLRGIGSFEQLGRRLIRLGETAHAFRRFDLVREVGQTLSHLPIRHFQTIGYYFLAVARNSCGKGNQREARRLFELAADTASSRYKAKAILSLAAVSAHAGNYEGELYYFNESLKASKDNDTILIAYRGMAVHKAREGYHRQALRDLENLAPLVKHAPASFYFDYLNSYAVELETTGRLVEAHNVSKLVLASAFAPAYPEWRETFSEINAKRKSRSTVAISRPQIQVDEQEYQPESDNRENVIRSARIQIVIDYMQANLGKKITG